LANLEKKIFMICPVRGITEAENSVLLDYIAGLEEVGAKVHYPPRDTNQDDSIGLKICSQNRTEIKKSLGVSLYYNPTSTGTVFDVGMAFMAEKPMFIINIDTLKKPNLTDFEMFLSEYASNSSNNSKYGITGFFMNADTSRSKLKRIEHVEYEWKENSLKFLFDFGMAFMAKKAITLSNRDYVETQRTPHKSFQNVLLALHGQVPFRKIRA
jgi:hypothetical protein